MYPVQRLVESSPKPWLRLQSSSYLQNNGLNGVNNKGGNKLMNNKYYAIMFKKLSEMSITTNDKVSVNTIFIQVPLS